MRAAASRTFWTAGNSRPMRMAMIAITTSSSISVKPGRHLRETIVLSWKKDKRDKLKVSPNRGLNVLRVPGRPGARLNPGTSFQGMKDRPDDFRGKQGTARVPGGWCASAERES